MAGNYPDLPGPRMALDADGSAMLSVIGGTATQWTNQQIKDVCDENAGTGGVGVGTGQNNGMVVAIFPEKRDIVGYFISVSGSWGWAGGGVLETSVDTTTGSDGTWVGRGAPGGVVNRGGAIVPAYRQNIQAVNWAGVKAVRWRGNTGGLDDFIPTSWHFYGAPSSGQALDRLAFWHPTLDQPLAAIDWGDVGRSATPPTALFRVKNLSAALTASNVVLDVISLTDSSNPTIAAGHTVSLDGASFAATKTIASIAPGAISAVCTLKWTPAATNQLGVWTGRPRAIATTWA